MQKRSFYVVAWALVLSLFCAFSGIFRSITAYADDVNTRYQITAADFVAKYDNIPASYLGTDGQYHDTTFHVYTALNGTQSSGLCYYPNGQSFNTTQMPMVWLYTTDVVYNDFTNNAAWEVEKVILHLNLHISNCSYMRFGISGYSEAMNGFYNLPAAAVSPYNYFTYHIPDSSFTESVYLGYYDTNYTYPCRLYNNSGSGCIQSWGYQSDTDMYISDLVLSCSTRDSSGMVWCGIYLPFVSENAVLEDRGAVPSEDVPAWGEVFSPSEMSGTVSDNGDGTQDINVTVNTDNSGLVASILNGIKNLFVPSDQDMQNFSDDMRDVAESHLGGLYEATDIITDAFGAIDEVSQRDSITVQTVNIPLLRGQTFTLGGWTVPLKPSTSGGFAVLYTGIALLADFLAAFAFLRMCHNKLLIILNPDSEVVRE